MSLLLHFELHKTSVADVLHFTTVYYRVLYGIYLYLPRALMFFLI